MESCFSHMASQVGVYTLMHEPDNALTPTSSSPVTTTVNNDLK